MMQKIFFLCPILSIFSVSAAPLNIGGSMDLGDPGKPVPGWLIHTDQINPAAAVKNPGMLIQTKTVPGKNGFALQTPAANGIMRFGLVCNRFSIDRDTEVEISFDYKCAREEAGKIRARLDFRTLGDRGLKPLPAWDHPRYPVLKGFVLRPSAEWQHVSHKFKVIKWHNDYLLTLNVFRQDGTPLQGSLFLDNFKCRFADSPEEPLEEAAAIPDRDGAAYRKGETIKLKLNARLNSQKDIETVILSAVADHNKTIRLKFPVKLIKHNFRYEGNLELKADLYGSWHFELSRNGRQIPVLGDFSVIHAPVKHPAYTPGWGIGYNHDTLVIPHTPYSDMFKHSTYRYYPSRRSIAEIPYLAGMRMIRIWGDWKTIEPEKNKFRSDVVGPLIDEAVRIGMDPVFCLSGTSLLFPDSDSKPEKATYPHHLRQYMKSIPGNKGLLLLDGPEEIWNGYLDFCLKTWGGKIRFWEFLNEPGAAECPPDVYIRYLKHVYKRIKNMNPTFKVLGNGNTCDVGFDKGWCARLTQADPDYVDSMDYCAFHPYWNSTDYIKGVYGLYTRHIQELRATLKKPRPLWNTECFYITNARKPQKDFYVNLGVCDAEAVQRHYLDGMLNGVEAALSLSATSFLKVAPPVTAIPALSEMATATNALSAHLAGMTKLQPVVLNPYMRAGIFSGPAGKAVGFVYDLRPAGSIMNVPAGRAVRITDLFGNAENSTKIRQSYEPHYIFGSLAAVSEFFRKAKFVPAESCRIFVKKAGNSVHINAINMTGQQARFTAYFTARTKLPAVQFAFHSSEDDSTAIVPYPDALPSILPFRPDDNEAGTQIAIRLPDVPEYPVGTDEETAQMLNVGKNAAVKVWSANGSLNFHAVVKDLDIVAPPGDTPWQGDAIEIFLDPTPFRRLDNNEILSSKPLNCYQYGFSAIPSKTGNSIKAISRVNPRFRSKAVLKQTRTEDGYILEGSIPWNEFRMPGTGRFGMEIGLHREGTDKIITPRPESLSNIPEKHYRHRFHYPVFRLAPEIRNALDGNSIPRNSDFSSGKYGEADQWGWLFQNSRCTVRFLPGKGFNGANAVELNATERFGKEFALTQNLTVPAEAKGVKLRALVKLDQITPDSKPINRYRPEGFMFQLGRWDFGNIVHSGMTGNTPWTSVECWIPFSNKAKQADLMLGLRRATGKVTISNINVEYFK